MTDFNRFCRNMSIVLATAVGGIIGEITVAQAANVTAGPTNRQFTIATLPEGNYRFCSDRPPSDIDRVSGVCFRFSKQGDRVTGDYYYPYEGSSVCLTGRVNGNTVSGQAVERLSPTSEPPEDLSEQLTSWRQEGFLQVGNGVYVDDRNRRDAIRYRSALLNLNNFYQYNAGAVLPPADCPTRPSSFIGVDPNPDDLREVGVSEFYEKPIYLDQSSIQAVEGDTYSYTTLVGRSERLSETDYRVDCRSLETVQVLRSRYYDRDGDLQELELVDQLVPANQDNPTSTQLYNASRYICRDYAQIPESIPETPPAEVSYERYSNERFNYSLLYPDDILTSQGELTDQDGQEFRSEDGNIILRVYGVNKGTSETLAQRYEQAQAGRSVTYQTIEDNDFFVVSGSDDGEVFYQKTLLENNVFKVLELRYSQALRQQIDPIARTIADSFATLDDSSAGTDRLPTEVQTAVIEAARANTEAESAIFEVVLAERETWPNGCLGLPESGEVCTQALVPGWRVQLEAEISGGMRNFTYRTDETGSQIRLEL